MWTIILRERDAQIIVRFYAPVHPHRRYCEAIPLRRARVCVLCVCSRRLGDGTPLLQQLQVVCHGEPRGKNGTYGPRPYAMS